MSPLSSFAAIVPLAVLLAAPALGQSPPGEGPALGLDRTTQLDITSGALTHQQIRQAGLKIFATPTNKLDGYGDGPMNPNDPISPGGRPTLQNNGTFLRVNGLDAQNCQECHSVGSAQTVPFTFAVGGVGASSANAIFQPRDIDVDDSDGNGFAGFNGRYINPPFLFGSGAVELLGKEMTFELQLRKVLADLNPGLPIPLLAKGVDFGTIVRTPGTLDYDTSGVVGVDEDLVVRPFGRKGEFPTVRAFDVEAVQFHFGMQPVEAVGAGVDGDNDGVADEFLVGELSALSIFATNLERPRMDPLTPEAQAGFELFMQIGCAGCHEPVKDTVLQKLPHAFPEVHNDPLANVYYESDLLAGPAGFEPSPLGGIRVPLFSDLKRHDMGPGLAETFGKPLDSSFITARLWGVADTAPYLHDGRALTLTDAILLHGGEAQTVRDTFDGLAAQDRVRILSFLRSLRTPTDPADDLF